MAVLPQYQRRGVGSRLVQAGLDECRRIGCEVVVVVGHPEYYSRFGFAPASRKGLRCEYAVPDEVFMVAELRPDALSGRSIVPSSAACDALICTPRLTTACTRPPTRCLSYSFKGSGRRVMPGVRFLFLVNEGS